jgi:uncharacterized membrane protein YqjE
MATQVDPDSEANVTALIGGIVQDARDLFVEQMTLFQVEVKNDARRTLAALRPLVIGLGVVFVGFGLLGIGGASLLCSAVPSIPVWLGYIIVGSIVVIAGGLLIYWGKSMLETVNPMPDTALNGLKENIQWKAKK